MFEDYKGNNKMANILKTTKIRVSHNSIIFLLNESACRPF